MFRKTFVEIDLNAFENNLKNLQQHVGRQTSILLPVKADAYGHGICEMSKFAQDKKLVSMFGVASIDEGIELRTNGITLPVLILGLILPEREQIEALLEYNLTPTVCDRELAKAISAIAEKNAKSIHTHLKVDTGMGRIGCRPEDALEIIETISSLSNIELEGIYSHFPVADENRDEFTLNQINTLKQIIQDAESRGFSIPLKHISNSAGLQLHNDPSFNMVRPGIMSYGGMPSPDMDNILGLVPVMTFKGSVLFVKRVKSGTPLSYGLTHTTLRDTNIATVSAGYGDGYNRQLSNRASVIINGNVYPVAGRVSMDQLLVDIGDDKFNPGDEVILFGKETITANTLADLLGTIPYEITCWISKRVPRLYLYKNQA